VKRSTLRTLTIATTLVAVAQLAPIVAWASPPPAPTPYTTQPYDMSGALGDPGMTWTCTGVRLWLGASVQDHFTCVASDASYSGTFTQAKPWACGCTGWASDYDGRIAKTYSIHIGNGQVTGIATY
jgi:hypothetical protein